MLLCTDKKKGKNVKRTKACQIFSVRSDSLVTANTGPTTTVSVFILKLSKLSENLSIIATRTLYDSLDYRNEAYLSKVSWSALPERIWTKTPTDSVTVWVDSFMNGDIEPRKTASCGITKKVEYLIQV